MKLNKINFETIFQNNGATLNNNGDLTNYKNGYQVSVCDLHIIKIRQKNKIKNTIIKETKKLKKGDYLGVWIDNKLCYIDKSKHFDDLQTALNIGKVNNQISIFDYANNNCIYLKGNR